MRKLFLFLTFLAQMLLTQHSLAEVTNFTLSGTSFYDQINFRAYGGFSGPPNPSGGAEIYNSCNEIQGNDFALGCNTDRVSLDTPIIVTFQETTDFTGSRQAIVFLDNDVATINNQVNITSSTNVTGPNQTVSVTFTWGDLCVEIQGATLDVANDRCTVNGVMDVFFGIDNGSGGVVSQRAVEFTLYTPSLTRTAGNNGDSAQKPLLDLTDYPNTPTAKACETSDDVSNGPGGLSYFGMCDMEIAPGDEKGILIEQQDSLIGHGLGIFGSNAADTFSGATEDDTSSDFNLDFLGVIVCHSTAGFDQTFPWNADDCRLLEFESPGVATLTDDEISGLTNGVTTYFRGATIDIANNVTTLFSDNMINTYCGTTTTLASEAAVLACPFATTPQLVVGLISENKCFISTATYGSEQAYQVKTFREFRKKFMWTNKLGLKLSSLYNQYGPYAANWIYKNPWSKKYARILLYPFYWFATGSLKYGFPFLIVSLVLFGLGLFVTVKRLVRIIL